MAKRGPKPTPVAIRVAEGTYRKSRHAGAVVAPSGVPAKPDWLGIIGSAAWDEVIAKLSETDGLLAQLDAGALALYCDAWEDYHNAMEVLNEEGAVCQGEKGGLYPNPAVGMKNNARATIIKLGSLFGMDPSSRAGLKVAPTKATGVRRRQAN